MRKDAHQSSPTIVAQTLGRGLVSVTKHSQGQSQKFVRVCDDRLQPFRGKTEKSRRRQHQAAEAAHGNSVSGRRIGISLQDGRTLGSQAVVGAGNLLPRSRPQTLGYSVSKDGSSRRRPSASDDFHLQGSARSQTSSVRPRSASSAGSTSKNARVHRRARCERSYRHASAVDSLTADEDGVAECWSQQSLSGDENLSVDSDDVDVSVSGWHSEDSDLSEFSDVPSTSISPSSDDESPIATPKSSRSPLSVSLPSSSTTSDGTERLPGHAGRLAPAYPHRRAQPEEAFDRTQKHVEPAPSSSSTSPTSEQHAQSIRDFESHTRIATIAASFVCALFLRLPRLPAVINDPRAAEMMSRRAAAREYEFRSMARMTAVLLYRTRLPYETLYTALYLLTRLKTLMGPGVTSSSGQTLLLTAFIVAHKYMADNGFSNASFSTAVSGCCRPPPGVKHVDAEGKWTAKAIGQLEQELCRHLDWKFRVDEEDASQFQLDLNASWDRSRPQMHDDQISEPELAQVARHHSQTTERTSESKTGFTPRTPYEKPTEVELEGRMWDNVIRGLIIKEQAKAATAGAALGERPSSTVREATCHTPRAEFATTIQSAKSERSAQEASRTSTLADPNHCDLISHANVPRGYDAGHRRDFCGQNATVSHLNSTQATPTLCSGALVPSSAESGHQTFRPHARLAGRSLIQGSTPVSSRPIANYPHGLRRALGNEEGIFPTDRNGRHSYSGAGHHPNGKTIDCAIPAPSRTPIETPCGTDSALPKVQQDLGSLVRNLHLTSQVEIGTPTATHEGCENSSCSVAHTQADREQIIKDGCSGPVTGTKRKCVPLGTPSIDDRYSSVSTQQHPGWTKPCKRQRSTFRETFTSVACTRSSSFGYTGTSENGRTDWLSASSDAGHTLERVFQLDFGTVSGGTSQALAWTAHSSPSASSSGSLTPSASSDNATLVEDLHGIRSESKPGAKAEPFPGNRIVSTTMGRPNGVSAMS